MKEFDLIKKWAEDRNLIEGSNTGAQMLKLYEEFGELTGAIAKQNEEIVIDSIGDIVVVLGVFSGQIGATLRKGPSMSMPEDVNKIILQIGKYIGDLGECVRTENKQEKKHIPFIMGALQFLSDALNLNFEECVRTAYNEIKNRKGKMVDGVFIKEEN